MDFGRRDFLTNLGLAALTCSSALTLYRSRGDDPRSAAYGAVVLLVYFLRRLERGEDGRGGITPTKVAVWALTTLLAAMFASRVAPLMPPPVGFVVYSMAAGTAGAGLWALFILRP